MKTFTNLAMMFLVTCTIAAQDQNKDVEDLKKQVEELKKRVDDLSGQQQGTIAEKQKSEEKKGVDSIYSKPFLWRGGRNVTVGGYIDLEFKDSEEKVSSFDQYRFVPFIYADVTDRVKVASELEFEHTGAEFGTEFAFADILFTTWLNFRAGAILLPLGKFNLVHDSPINELTSRPLVSTNLLGTVLRDPGVGFWGRLLDDTMLLDYEIYVTNGFEGLDKTGTRKIDTSTGLKNATPKKGFGDAFRDFNQSKATTARLMFMPHIGIELGASAHLDKYDFHNENALNIYALDWDFQIGAISNMVGLGDDVSSVMHRLTLKGEYGYVDIERNSFAKSKGVPNDFHAWYMELDVAITPGFLDKLSPEAQFTFVIRYESQNLAGFGTTIWTPGVNLHVSKYTKIKLEYQVIGESMKNPEADNDTWLLSVATYL